MNPTVWTEFLPGMRKELKDLNRLGNGLHYHNYKYVSGVNNTNTNSVNVRAHWSSLLHL